MIMLTLHFKAVFCVSLLLTKCSPMQVIATITTPIKVVVTNLIFNYNKTCFEQVSKLFYCFLFIYFLRLAPIGALFIHVSEKQIDFTDVLLRVNIITIFTITLIVLKLTKTLVDVRVSKRLLHVLQTALNK